MSPGYGFSPPLCGLSFYASPAVLRAAVYSSIKIAKTSPCTDHGYLLTRYETCSWAYVNGAKNVQTPPRRSADYKFTPG